MKRLFSTRTQPAPERAKPPICYFCSSTDTMEPFHRPAEIFLLTRLLPSLRWRYCRSCTRHFLTLTKGR
jgi:hypothetical protein